MAETNWSQDVTTNSGALDVEDGVFNKQDPQEIAQSLKHSAETSRKRTASPFRSAMSMLTLYINRAGTQLSVRRRRILERAKSELRVAFERGRR
jgi:hypothetical protein